MLAVEEPLEIRIGGTPLTVTMRTPGDDIDLAAGFLFCEGLLNPSVDLRQIRMCDENVADVTLEPSAPGADHPDAAGSPELPDHQRLRRLREGKHRRDPGQVPLRPDHGRPPGLPRHADVPA